MYNPTIIFAKLLMLFPPGLVGLHFSLARVLTGSLGPTTGSPKRRPRFSSYPYTLLFWGSQRVVTEGIRVRFPVQRVLCRYRNDFTCGDNNNYKNIAWVKTSILHPIFV